MTRGFPSCSDARKSSLHLLRSFDFTRWELTDCTVIYRGRGAERPPPRWARPLGKAAECLWSSQLLFRRHIPELLITGLVLLCRARSWKKFFPGPACDCCVIFGWVFFIGFNLKRSSSFWKSVLKVISRSVETTGICGASSPICMKGPLNKLVKVNSIEESFVIWVS